MVLEVGRAVALLGHALNQVLQVELDRQLIGKLRLPVLRGLLHKELHLLAARETVDLALVAREDVLQALPDPALEEVEDAEALALRPTAATLDLVYHDYFRELQPLEVLECVEVGPRLEIADLLLRSEDVDLVVEVHIVLFIDRCLDELLIHLQRHGGQVPEDAQVGQNHLLCDANVRERGWSLGYQAPGELLSRAD